MLLLIASLAVAGRPRYVFYFIGDGMGAAHRQLAEIYLREKTGDPSRKLLINSFGVAGLITTYSKDSLITDSAAAGTALSTGKKTLNGLIAKTPEKNDLKTLIEAAEDGGMATGIITTTKLTHATPATFAAHNDSRKNENEIAEDYLNSNVEFFAGGGIRHFIEKNRGRNPEDAMGYTGRSNRGDEKNLVNTFGQQGYTTFIGMTGAAAFSNTDFSSIDKVFAAFTYFHLPYEIERIHRYKSVPSLAEMTKAGIKVLARDPDGFFLMVEGGRIDHAAHSNDPTGVIHDTLALDHAVKAAHDFYLAHRNDTLIVVTADHETGGLGLGGDAMHNKLNIGALMDTKLSIGDTLIYGSGRYNGNPVAYRTLLGTQFGLDRLSPSEAEKLEQAMDDIDAGMVQGFYTPFPAALAAAHILSNRANIGWTTTKHTAVMIPLSAAGSGAERFSGYRDNTEIALETADLLGFDLTP